MEPATRPKPQIRLGNPPSLLRNIVSFFGIVVAGVSTALGLPMMFIESML